MNAKERSVVLPVTFGSFFEWYEVYLYLYWSPIIAQSFFDISLPFVELIYALVILSVGLLARPLGGIIFGNIGDRKGRKVAFLISIVAITIPSLGVAFMPSFTTWAYFSVIYIGIMRFFQGIPAGGELPGALCLLAEGATPNRKRYICSFLFIGPQIGQLLGMVQSFLLQNFLSNKELLQWGWRLSFLISGFVGLSGFFIRRKLHESEAFKNLKTNHKIEYHPLRESFKNYKKNIFIGLFISIFEVVGFFTIYFYLFQESNKIFGLSSVQTLITYSALLILIIFLMPIMGWIGDKISNHPLLKLSAIGIIFLTLPFYFSITNDLISMSFILLILIIIFFTIQFSLLPALIANLFPTRIRFTCIGFSFNIADGVIGGLIPYFGYLLTKNSGNPSAFIFLFPISALIFLFTLRFHKKIKKYE